MCTPPGDGLLSADVSDLSIQNCSFNSAPDTQLHDGFAAILPQPEHRRSCSSVLRTRRRMSRTRLRARGYTHGGSVALSSEWQFWFESARGDGGCEQQRSWPFGCSFRHIKLFWQVYHSIDIDAVAAESLTVHLLRQPSSPPFGDGYFKIRCGSLQGALRLWHDVVMVLIGEQFQPAGRICGAGFSPSRTIIYFWVSGAADAGVRRSIREQLVCLVPQGTRVSYRAGTGAPALCSPQLPTQGGRAAADAVAPPVALCSSPIPVAGADCPGLFASPAARSLSASRRPADAASRSLADRWVPTTRVRSHSLPSRPSRPDGCADDVEVRWTGLSPAARRGYPQWLLAAGERPRARSDALEMERAAAARVAEASPSSPPPAARAAVAAAPAPPPRHPRPPRPAAQTLTARKQERAAASTLRKVLSANDLEGFVPAEPLYTAMQGPGMKHSGSWADEEEDSSAPQPSHSQSRSHSEGPSASSSAHSHRSHARNSPETGRRTSVSAGSPSPPASARGVRTPLLPSPSLARHDEQRRPEGWPADGALLRIATGADDAPGSGPPSLGHSASVPVSPSGPLMVAASVLNDRHTPSPSPSCAQPCSSTFSSASTPPLAPPGAMLYDHPRGRRSRQASVDSWARRDQQQQQQQAAVSFVVTPASPRADRRESAAAAAPIPQAALPGAARPVPTALPLARSPCALPMAQPAIVVGGAGTAAAQPPRALPLGIPQRAPPLVAPAPLPQAHQLGAAAGSVQPALPLAPAAALPAGLVPRLPVAAVSAAAAHPKPDKPESFDGYPVEAILQFLTGAAGAPQPADDEEAAKERLSKSRSPRNRRKIRERKIREAADAMRREMAVWASVCGTPADAWYSPSDNEVLDRPAGDAFDVDSWFRFVQACRKEKVAMASLPSQPDDHLERLGCETKQQVDAVRRVAKRPGPRPHPLAAVTQCMRERFVPAGCANLLQPPVNPFC
eukprot:TRINITY_DN8583_c0_g1_i2.p1 TRINITY_DN8583_c0_g1~~TRINITY_DN8583_c0_g1_i2.p1  ORF type:complete len:963 (+),score=249.96 TRINITY_DN8583_c0_g1_i2:84-2972(+)